MNKKRYDKYMKKKAQVSIFIILGLVMLFSASLAFYLASIRAPSPIVAVQPAMNQTISLSPMCIDGTPFGSCSAIASLKCIDGKLTPACGECGCLADEACLPSGDCQQRQNETQTVFNVFFVPVNYAPDDRDFLERVETMKSLLFLNTGLVDNNVVVVDKTLLTLSCDDVARQLDSFVDAWWQARTGHSLPGLQFDGRIPVYQYRIIGIDSHDQDTALCGCAHTLLYSPVIYIGGAACGREQHVVLHELSHTFGLCDEYDTCVWEDTNEFELEAFGHPCFNAKPSQANSDCEERCCSTDQSKACCLGKYADAKEDGYFSVLGSSDVPPKRRLARDSRAVFESFLCTQYGVCK